MAKGERNAELGAARALANRLPMGTRFGLLEVIGYEKGAVRWNYRVRCACGVVKVAQRGNLARAKSCGCLTGQLIAASRTRHGETDSPTWRTWKSMLERCEWPRHKSWADYGGRGIKVCPSWHIYENFRADMGERPAGTQLDRVDNEKGYEPGNCRWSTPRQNANNRRSTVFIAFRGERLSLSQWARRLRCAPSVIWHRVHSGWSIEDALTRAPKRQRNSRTFGGAALSY